MKFYTMVNGESEHCHFDLTQDIIDGDLKILGECSQA